MISKNGCSPLLYIRDISFEQIFKDFSITFIPHEIFYQCLVGIYFTLRQFVLCNNGYSLLLSVFNYLPCISLLGRKPSTLNMFYFLSDILITFGTCSMSPYDHN